MQHPSALLDMIHDYPLLSVGNRIVIPPEDRAEAAKMVDILPVSDVMILSAIASGAAQGETAKIIGISQPSLHFRLRYLVRWLNWCPSRRRALRYFEKYQLPAYSGRQGTIRLSAAWQQIVWQHRPLMRVAQPVGAHSQGHLRHRWMLWLDELIECRFPDRVISALNDLRHHPVIWRVPQTADNWRHPTDG